MRSRRTKTSYSIFALFLLACAACEKVETSVPREILGTWSTLDPPYEERVMRFNLDRVHFGSDDSGLSSHSVVAVRSEKMQEFTTVAIDYASPDEVVFTLHLKFYPRSNELRLTNRQDPVWTRKQPERGG